MTHFAKDAKARKQAFPKAGKVSLRKRQVPNSTTALTKLSRLTQSLTQHYGPQNWWPGQSRFEVIAGAYLTQNTSWGNVEKALTNLRRARLLNLSGIRQSTPSRLEELLRPSGYFRQKARYLRAFVQFADEHYQGSLEKMFRRPTLVLKSELLSLPGVGEETADAILLYAGQHKTFVVDAYARRILKRHGLPWRSNAEMQKAFEIAMDAAQPLARSTINPRHPESQMSRIRRSPTVQSFNEAHALLVRVGNDFCRKAPRCELCPLQGLLSAGRPATN